MDSFILKLTGSAELPKALPIGHNVHVMLEGSIVAETITDNDDGSNTHYFKFKPIVIETLNEKGERIRAKDARSRSQQMRALLFKRWREGGSPQEFENWYEERMVELMATL